MAVTLQILDYLEMPEPQLTCENMDVLVTGAVQLLRTLDIVAHDLAWAKQGRQLAFALDFSELHSILWPERSRSHTQQITRALLQQEHLTLTLPPGATLELLHQLRRAASSQQRTRRSIGEFLARPMVAAFVKLFEQARGTPLPEALKASTEVQAAVRELAVYSALADNLRMLNSARNLKPMESVLEDDERIALADPDILRQCLTSLNFRRPGLDERNNFVDAHNYALVWSLSSAGFKKHNRIHLLVTSSPIPYYVFRQHVWSKFPETVAQTDLPELPLVRHPIQTLYFGHASKHGTDGIIAVRRLRRDLGVLVDRWRALPEYDSYLKQNRSSTSLVSLPKTASYLESYLRFRRVYGEVFGTVRQAIVADLVAEENVRLLKAVSPYEAGARALGNLGHEGPVSSTRVIFDLFDRVSEITATTVRRLEQTLDKLPKALLREVDVNSVLVRPVQAHLHIVENEEFKCLEIVGRRSDTQGRWFAADIYKSYYSVWWQSGVTVADFVREAGRFAAGVRRRRLPTVTEGRKRFYGIYLYQEGSHEPILFPFEEFPDLDLGQILAAAGDGVAPTMLRLAFDFGDICYDVAAYREIPQRVGFMSHIKPREEIAWLLVNTSVERVGIMDAKRAVANLFRETEKRGWLSNG